MPETLYPDWMQQNYAAIRWRTLRQMCLPFSHDAGMSQSKLSAGLPRAQLLTQKVNIGGQLSYGARFFDIRPFENQGSWDYDGAQMNHETYFTVHGSFADGGKWYGGGGQPLQEICDQINEFTSQHAELIILELSHAVVGTITTIPSKMNYMSQEQYENVFKFLSTRIQKLYVCPDPHVDLTYVTMADFIGEKQACVIVTLSDHGITIPDSLLGHGFYYGCLSTDVNEMRAAAKAGRRSQLYYAGGYSESDDPNFVENDQFTKLALYRGGMDSSPPFLLEFTITEAGADLAFSSIRDGSEMIKPRLLQNLPGKVTKETYPTMIGVDYFEPAVTKLMLDNIINSPAGPVGHDGDRFSQAGPLGCIMNFEVVAARYGPKEVTGAIWDDFHNWLDKDGWTWKPFSTAPYTIHVSNDNPLLGPDPAVGVPKRLMVLIRRFAWTDKCISHCMLFSAGEGETLSIDPRDMTLKQIYAQMPEIINNQKQGGQIDWGMLSATWGPIDPCARAEVVNSTGKFDDGPIGPYDVFDQVQALRRAASKTSTPDQFKVDFNVPDIIMPCGDMTGIPCQLRVLMEQRCLGTNSQNYSIVNTTTYWLVTALDGDIIDLGPKVF